MEEPLPQQDADLPATWNDDVTQVLEEQRARVISFVEAQRRRFHDVESRLTALIQEIADELDTSRQQEELRAAKPKWRRSQIGWNRSRPNSKTCRRRSPRRRSSPANNSARPRRKSNAAKQSYENRSVNFMSASKSWTSNAPNSPKTRSRYAHGRERLEERMRQLDADREELSEQFERFKQQRRQVAEQFKRQRGQQQERLNRLRSELENAQRSGAGDAAADEAHRQLARAERQRDEFQQHVEQLQTELEQSRNAVPGDEAAGEWESEAARLRERLTAESNRVAELESELATAHERDPAPAPAPRSQAAKLRI